MVAEHGLCSAASACDTDPVSAIGDPHVISVSAEKSDLWKTGSSMTVQTPKDIQLETVPQHLEVVNVAPYGCDACALDFPHNVKLSGSMLGNHERCGAGLPGRSQALQHQRSWQQLPAHRLIKRFGNLCWSLLFGNWRGLEPGAWSPRAKLQMTIGALLVTVKQRPEGRSAGSS